MKISNDDQRAIGLILFCVAVLCFLIGIAGHFKSEYHHRGEISCTGFTIAIILAAAVNGKFYVMGGDDFNNGLNTTFIYDIATNSWTTGATLPDSRTAEATRPRGK